MRPADGGVTGRGLGVSLASARWVRGHLRFCRQVPRNMFRAMLPGRSPARVQHSPDPTPGVVRDIERAVGTLCEPHRPMVGVGRQVHGPFTDEAVREDLRRCEG